MIDDLEEIKLEPDRSGSARVIRAGKKRAALALAETKNKARWIRELRRYNRKPWKPRKP